MFSIINNILWVILALSLLVVVLSMGYKGIKIVAQGRAYTVERLGKYTRTLTAGMNFIMPFYESVGDEIDMRQQHMDLEPQQVITADSASLTVDAVVFYQITDIEKSVYEVADFKGSMTNWVITAIRGGMGSMTLTEVLAQRDRITDELLSDADDITGPWGIKIQRIKIKDIQPPEDVLAAMSEQLKSEKQKASAILKAQGESESIRLIAQARQQESDFEADAQKNRLIKESEAKQKAAQLEALGKRDLADADAHATKVMSEAIKNGDIQAVNFFVAEKYVSALKDMASAKNHKVIMMPLESSNLLGALSGITEIAKEAFNNNSPTEKNT